MDRPPARAAAGDWTGGERVRGRETSDLVAAVAVSLQKPLDQRQRTRGGVTARRVLGR